VTDPRHAVATEHGRYYYDPNPEFAGRRYPSVTNVLDTAIHKPALVPWAAKVTAEYAVNNLPALSKAVRLDPESAIKELKSQVRYIKETAAELGSRIHAAAEAHALGAPVADDPDVKPFLKQYLAWLDAWGVDLERDVEVAECSMVNRSHDYAGTADVFLWLRLTEQGVPDASSRTLWLIDYKTSSTRPAVSLYPENVLQLAALRNCEALWAPDDTEHPVPPVAGCAVLNLRQRSHAFIPVPADGAAFEAFLAALSVTRYLHALDFTAEALTSPHTTTARAVGEAA
jgi:hypothetical protein